jgi:hypothetical protein
MHQGSIAKKIGKCLMCQGRIANQRPARPETAIDECGGDGGDPGGWFFLRNKSNGAQT